MIDFIYGVNLSRALTQSFNVSNDSKRYRNLSIGRVQGPTLAFVVDREMEITRHVPESYWNVSGEFEKNGYIIKANYYQQKISALSQATSIVNSCTNENGKITRIENQKVTFRAPTPFNLGDLQKEAYRVFKFSPSYTLTIAEKLYIDALISYPRTASQQLPTRKLSQIFPKLFFLLAAAIMKVAAATMPMLTLPRSCLQEIIFLQMKDPKPIPPIQQFIQQGRSQKVTLRLLNSNYSTS